MGTRVIWLLRKVAGATQAAARRERLRSAASRAIRDMLAWAGTTVPVQIGFDPAIVHAHDALVRRTGTSFEIRLSSHNPSLTREHGAPRLPAYLYWLMHSGPEVAAITVTLSDGDRTSAALFSPSTFIPEVVPIPDPIFFASNGYAAERTASLSQALPWEARSEQLVWRGGMNSQQSFDPEVARLRPSMAAQRLLASLALSGVAGTDVKFTHVHVPETARAAYDRLGIAGPPVESATWLGRKYALDIDGYSNAWSNLLTRLLFGCCVLKVESRFGYRQWYYDRLKPWEHYVPVAADLSDIVERLDWVRTHDRESREIAQRGRHLALGMTLSSVTAEAAALIGANWQRTR